jgi:hypothetical protein
MFGLFTTIIGKILFYSLPRNTHRLSGRKRRAESNNASDPGIARLDKNRPLATANLYSVNPSRRISPVAAPLMAPRTTAIIAGEVP